MDIVGDQKGHWYQDKNCIQAPDDLRNISVQD